MQWHGECLTFLRCYFFEVDLYNTCHDISSLISHQIHVDFSCIFFLILLQVDISIEWEHIGPTGLNLRRKRFTSMLQCQSAWKLHRQFKLLDVQNQIIRFYVLHCLNVINLYYRLSFNTEINSLAGISFSNIPPRYLCKNKFFSLDGRNII